MKRRFYANLAGSYAVTRLTERVCPNGHRLAEEVKVTPEPFIVKPPYKRTPEQYRQREEVIAEWCRECKST